jgi:beta/gamma crystallin
MSKHYLRHLARGCAAVAATVALAGPASAQQRGPILFADIDFNGTSRAINQDIPDMRQLGLNDTISSIEIPNGQVWQICEDINYQGRCQNVSGNVSDLRNGDWNDRISSMRLVSGNGFRNRRFGAYRNDRNNPYYGSTGTTGSYNGQPQLVFYNRANFRGASHVVTPGDNTLFSGREGSLRVNGGVWRLCDARGECATVDRDVSNIDQLGLSERITSVREMDNRNFRRYR